jgi:PAS domain S-box-containing protein
MNKQITLSKDTMIVTETDTKGKIIFASKDFCTIAEYTQEELIGKAHNIVRHEDMPKAAFQDLWNILHKGFTWNGIVKNKTKNGNYYWVNATAFPSKTPDGELKYISIRVKPTDEEVQKASLLYKTMK